MTDYKGYTITTDCETVMRENTGWGSSPHQHCELAVFKNGERLKSFHIDGCEFNDAKQYIDNLIEEKKNPHHNCINGKGQFQSHHHPGCPAGYVPFSVHDPLAQPLLYAYALRKMPIDPEFSEDLIFALVAAGYDTDSYPGFAG